MIYKIWNWTIIAVMFMAMIASTIAAYSNEWDKATYFALFVLMGKFALDEDKEFS